MRPRQRSRSRLPKPRRIVAGRLGILALSVAAPASGSAQTPAGPAVQVPAVQVPAVQVPAVQVQMQNVAFHIDSSGILRIRYLRGELRRMSASEPPFLDDKRSFMLRIDSATIAITPATLSDLLNHYTFAYPGSPLRNLTITIEQGRLKQQGVMRGISFTMLGDLTLTPDGELRLHPSSIKAAGIGVGGLMKFFGLHLQKLVDTRGARGVRIDHDDFLLSPAKLLPPPTVEGRLGVVEVTDSEIVQVFRPAAASAPHALGLPPIEAANYMYFRHGVLRFGKLTMVDTDLLIVDADPQDPFDFFLDHYNEQLVAGHSRNTADHGLIVLMPDYHRVAARERGTARSPAARH